jgi:predicted regulator of Ras-like GTPase activity (Roadblock/LC7/MglB family)
VDAAAALKDLTEISSQIHAAVLLSSDGQTLASTIDDETRSERLSAAVRSLVAAATSRPGVEGEKQLVQLEAATSEGSLFVVRDDVRVAAAVTKAEPTAGLVFFDLKSCLRAAAAEEGDGKPRPRARTRKAATAVEASE